MSNIPACVPLRPAEELHQYLDGLLDRRDIIPLGAMGMDPPGPLFTDLAHWYGDPQIEEPKKGAKKSTPGVQSPYGPHLHNLIRNAVYSDGLQVLPLQYRGRWSQLTIISGHPHWAPHCGGPLRADVMVVGKNPREDERNLRLQLAGQGGELFYQVLRSCGVHDFQNWYLTTLVKTVNPESGDKAMSASYIKSWYHILQQEVRLVRPRFILVLGADVAKFFFGKSATLQKLEGQVLDYEFSLDPANHMGPMHHALAMVTVEPSRVLQEPRDRTRLEQAASRFNLLLQGKRWDREAKARLEMTVVSTYAGLLELEQKIEREIRHNLVTVDAEWEGSHPQNAGAYLRCIQLAWDSYKTAVLDVRDEMGAWKFDVPQQVVYAWLRNLLSRHILGGHFFNSDQEWLEYDGCYLRDLVEVPATHEEYRRKILAGEPTFADSSIFMHATDETQALGLKSAAMRKCGYPRWDIELHAWICQHIENNNTELDGFGKAPGAVLHPYGAFDASATWDVIVSTLPLLDSDELGLYCWEPCWRTLRAMPAAYEMTVTGIPVNRERLEQATQIFLTVRDEMLSELRQNLKWPDFNPNSVFHVREMLYGEALNGKPRANPQDPPIRLRPFESQSLYLTPVLSSGKRKMAWDEVLRRGMVGERWPSTDKTTLAILANMAKKFERQTPQGVQILDLSGPVKNVRNLKFIGQALKFVLRPPQLVKKPKKKKSKKSKEVVGEVVDRSISPDGIVTVFTAPDPVSTSEDDSPDWARDRDGRLVYDKGLPSMICADGRLRASIIQTKETGRWAASRPNLMALSKRREREFKQILKEKYPGPTRAILEAPPGYLIVETDYIGAELVMMAIASGDKRMLDHARRSQLDEDHPEYYDIHSNLTAKAFHLNLPEPVTKSALQAAGYGSLRDVGKCTVFGTAYGLTPEGVAIQAREEGVDVTDEEAKAVQDYFLYEMYPDLPPYFAALRARANTPRWTRSLFQRARRVPAARDRKQLGDYERELGNFPIQGGVADAMQEAVHAFRQARRYYAGKVDFQFILQVHDALLFFVYVPHVQFFMDQVVPFCMRDSVPMWRADLDGVRTGEGPYFLGPETACYKNWGETPLPGEFLSYGVSPTVAKWKLHSDGVSWVHKAYAGKVWRDGQLHSAV